jgi:hypothetical protein
VRGSRHAHLRKEPDATGPPAHIPELPLSSHTVSRLGVRTGFVVALALAAATAARSRTLEPGLGICRPPRTVVALVALADRTDGVWTNWSGQSPAQLVTRLLADSLADDRGCDVLRLNGPQARGATAAPQRPVDDDLALRAARRTSAEVVVTGSVDVFSHDDHLEPGKFTRWGMGAPDARSSVHVSVTLRALNVRDGTVLIETNASRERTGKTVATIDRPERTGSTGAIDPLIAQALGEVLGDLARTLERSVESRWKANVLSERHGDVVLDAGVSKGVFPGERLDVWRPGIALMDEDLARLGDDMWVGSVVVTSLRGRTRARARLVDGEVHVGDLVKPCSLASPPALSLRR